MSQFAISVYKQHYIHLVRIGLPIVFGQLGMIILGFADTIMIGRHTAIELAAASLVNNIFTLAIIFGTGFAYGLTPIVGELFGKGDRESIGEMLKNSLLANTIMALFITAIMTVLYFNIDKMGQPEELMPHVKPYFLVTLASMIFVMLFNAFKQFAEGITDTKTPMWILFAGNAINIIGNYILIYGKCGAPELGLLGAGLSTLASRIAMLLAFIVIFAKARRYAPYRQGFLQSHLSMTQFRKLNSVGWPVAMQMGMESASFNLSAVMVGWLGSLQLAAHQIGITFATLSYMILYGVGAATAIRVSYFKGMQETSNARRASFAGFHLVLVVIVAVSIFYLLARNAMGGWFTDDREVSAMAATLVYVMILYQIGDGTQIVFANALRGISDVKPMMYIAFFAYFVISLPASYLLGFTFGLGLYGIWLAYPIGLTTAGVLFYLRFNKMTAKTLATEAIKTKH